MLVVNYNLLKFNNFNFKTCFSCLKRFMVLIDLWPLLHVIVKLFPYWKAIGFLINPYYYVVAYVMINNQNTGLLFEYTNN